MSLENKTKELYNIFKGLPSGNPIVRENTENDAFEIVVYDILFRKNKFNRDLTIEDLEEIENCIPAPPDDGIDIFFEDEDDEKYPFHIVQVKNTSLMPREIKDCFATMKRTMKSYTENTGSIGNNLKTVMSNYSFDPKCLDKCKYYVVHSGDTEDITDQNLDENIITTEQLNVILASVPSYSVPREELEIDHENNFIGYSKINNPNVEKSAYQVNLNAYDLAILCRKYINTEIGRNILFGQNVRESIIKGSKTYEGMCATIDNEPENFWFYNNGITIIANDISIITKDNKTFFQLKNFSIINGAQTTSTFSNYLKEAIINKDDDKQEKLKKVFVAARLVQTGTNKELKRNITIYNNTQNPISSRDMVANNEEQLQLQKKLKDNTPSIFMQIRRGELKPKSESYLKFRIISNDEIAQLCFAGFLKKPFTSKDKKSTLFNRDNSNSNYIINQDYDSVFKYSLVEGENGELFKRNNHDIDELLFVRFLHDKAKKFQKDFYEKQLETYKSDLNNSKSESEKKTINGKIESLNRIKQINSINTFYNIALYWELKRKFDVMLEFSNLVFDIEKYFSDKASANSLNKDFAKVFNVLTISIFNEKCGGNPSQFSRAKKSQEIFFDTLEEKMSLSTEIMEGYQSFVEKYKINI